MRLMWLGSTARDYKSTTQVSLLCGTLPFVCYVVFSLFFFFSRDRHEMRQLEREVRESAEDARKQSEDFANSLVPLREREEANLQRY